MSERRDRVEASRPAPDGGERASLGRRFLWLAAAGISVATLKAAARILPVPPAPPVPPDDNPLALLKKIGLRLFQRVYDDRMLSVAAGVTFYALLALFPGITAFISLYGLVADPNTVIDHVQSLSGVLPAAGVELVSEQVRRIAGKGAGTLGLAFFTGLAVSLWSAMAGLKAIFEALNVAEGRAETRSFLEVNALALVFTLGSIVFVALAITLLVVIPVGLDLVGIDRESRFGFNLLRWPLLFSVAVLYMAVLYHFGPSGSGLPWGWVTIGSCFAALLWLLASLAFSAYVSGFASYNETYGSLGAAMAFMTWIWISASIVLFGAVLNAELPGLLPKPTAKLRADMRKVAKATAQSTQQARAANAPRNAPRSDARK